MARDLLAARSAVGRRAAHRSHDHSRELRRDRRPPARYRRPGPHHHGHRAFHGHLRPGPDVGMAVTPDGDGVRRRGGGAGGIRRRGTTGALTAGEPGAAAEPDLHHPGRRGHHRQRRLHRDSVPVDAEPAAGTRPQSTDRRHRVPRPLGRRRTRRRAVGPHRRPVPTGTRHGYRVRRGGGIACRACCFAALGAVPGGIDGLRIHHGPGVRLHHGRHADSRRTRARGRGSGRHPHGAGDPRGRRCRSLRNRAGSASAPPRHDGRGHRTHPAGNRGAAAAGRAGGAPEGPLANFTGNY